MKSLGKRTIMLQLVYIQKQSVRYITLLNIEIDPSQDTLYNNRGLTYMNLLKMDLAKADLSKGIELNRNNIKALKRLSCVHTSLGELSEAEMYLKQCIDVEPNVMEHKEELKTFRDLIDTKEELFKAKVIKNWKRVLELSHILVEKCSNCLEIKSIYLEALIRNYQIEQSLAFYRSNITQEEKQKDNMQYLLSLAYFNDGKYDKAKQTLNILIARTKDDAFLESVKSLFDKLELIQTEKEKANQCFKANDYKGAIDLYTKLLDMDTNNVIFNSLILSNRSLCYYKLKELFAALSDINTSIELNKKYWRSYQRRANINIALKDPEKSKEDLRKVLELDPNNRDAIILLDDIIREEKKCNRRDFYKILELNKNASKEEIKKAYRRLAQIWHPDKNNKSEEQKKYAEKMFKDLNEAKNILSDDRKRTIYDSGAHPDDPYSKFHSQEEQHYTNNFNCDFSNRHNNDKNDGNNNKDNNNGYKSSYYNDDISSKNYKRRERSRNK